MPDRRIFVSYGQVTETERALGRRLRDLIEAHGMTAFVAGEVHTAAGLNAEIFGAIQTCYAFLAVLHHRGEVRYGSYPPTRRSSVWIQQEIAIFAYRMFLEGSPRPIMVYSQQGLRLEGLMQAAIVNPVTFERDEEVIGDVETWLASREFEEDPILRQRERFFRRRLDGLSGDALLSLELIVTHSVGAGERADYQGVIADFCSVLGVPQGDAAAFHRAEVARRDLMTAGLISFETSPITGQSHVSVQRQWWQLMVDDFRRRGRHV